MSSSFLISLFLSILLVATAKLNFNSALTSALNTAAEPVLSPLAFLRAREIQLLHFLTGLPSLATENAKLAAENNLQKIKIKQLTEALADQTLANSLDQRSWQIQPIRLVSFGSSAIFTSRDFGALRPGQPVVSENSLLGIVKSVQPPVIKVIPLTDGQIKVAAQLDTGARGDYVYKNGRPFLTNLPTGVAFNPKTIVLTLPTEQIPENLVIGQIERITSNSANPTQEATLTLNREIGSAADFYVITSP